MIQVKSFFHGERTSSYTWQNRSHADIVPYISKRLLYTELNLHNNLFRVIIITITIITVMLNGAYHRNFHSISIKYGMQEHNQ